MTMDNEYKDLLTRSIRSEEALTSAVESLKETSKSINDNLASHNASIGELCKIAHEGNKLSEANNIILMKYLKWAILALITVLSGQKLVNELLVVAKGYGV